MGVKGAVQLVITSKERGEKCARRPHEGGVRGDAIFLYLMRIAVDVIAHFVGREPPAVHEVCRIRVAGTGLKRSVRAIRYCYVCVIDVLPCWTVLRHG